MSMPFQGVEVFGVGERRCFVIPSVDGRNGNDVSRPRPGKRRGRVLIGIGEVRYSKRASVPSAL